jgi:hypothetical protein
MTCLDDPDDSTLIVYFVDHAIVPLPYPIAGLSRELLTGGCARLVAKRVDSTGDATAVLRRADRLEFS